MNNIDIKEYELFLLWLNCKIETWTQWYEFCDSDHEVVYYLFEAWKAGYK